MNNSLQSQGMQSHCNPLPSAQPRTMSEIEQEMNSLDNAINRAASRREALSLRLAGISRSPGPQPNGKALAAAQGTEVGRALADFAERINAIAEMLEDDLQRLAL